MSIVNGHRAAAGWSLGSVVAVLTILALLGMVPWATRAEVKEIKADVGKRLETIESKLDRLLERQGERLTERRTPSWESENLQRKPEIPRHNRETPR